MPLNFLRSIWTGSDKPLGGRYQIVEQLGAGGFGHTYLAHDLHLPGQPLCVVKQLRPQVKSAQDLQVARRLFDTEAQVLYELGIHPQIPRLLAHFEENQEFYLAQELIDGHSLSEELEANTPWSEPAVVALLGDILGALAFVHKHRVIHRDLKPSNLMRRHRDNRMVLIDFGAVKQASTQLASSQTGISHTISIGTQGYMPNEQLGGTPHFSSDVYAVGMIGIQALTGWHPRLLTPDPRTGEVDWHSRAPRASAELVAVLDRMVKYDFRSRYSTAADALDALQTLPEALTQAIPPALGFHAHGNFVPLQSSNPAIAPISPNTDPTTGSTIDLNATPEALPITQPDASGALPVTQRDSDSSASFRAEVSSGSEASGAGQTLPALGRHPHEPVVPSGNTAGTRPISAANRYLARKKSLDTELLPKNRSWQRLTISMGAIAAVLGIGLLSWRACTPTTSMSPAATVQSDETTDASETAASTEASTGAEAEISPFQNALQQAQNLRSAKQYEQALAQYDEAIALDDRSTEAHAGRCYILNQLQRYEDAVAACDRAIALNPQNAEALWSKGYALDQRERHKEALELYDQALAIDPDFAEAWSNKGTALLAVGNAEQAVEALNRAVELDPDLPEAWNSRGAALWSLRRFDEALASVERALEIRPNYEDAKTLRQEMRRRLGRS